MNKTNLSKVQQEAFDPAILNDIEGYWDERSKTFSETRKREMSGPGGAAWLKLLSEHLPTGRTLKVLDIGTGAGFFAILLAKLGHNVTGIDMSSSMLHEAKLNALALGVRAKFQKMNAQETDFDDNTFDAIITRNLTLRESQRAECSRCGRRYDLNTQGIVIDGPTGRSLFRYRATFYPSGNTLTVSN